MLLKSHTSAASHHIVPMSFGMRWVSACKGRYVDICARDEAPLLPLRTHRISISDNARAPGKPKIGASHHRLHSSYRHLHAVIIIEPQAMAV